MSNGPTAAAHSGQNIHIRSSRESVKFQLVQRGRNNFYSLCFAHPREEKHQIFDIECLNVSHIS